MRAVTSAAAPVRLSLVVFSPVFSLMVACQSGAAPSAEGPRVIEPSPLDAPATPPTGIPTPASARWVMAYYPGYERSQLPSAEIDWAHLTHLAVGAVLPRADGTLDTTYAIDATKGPAMAKELVELAHDARRGKKALVMVGGEGAHDAWVAAAAPAKRAAFVQSLVALRRSVGYDGYDLDWEPIPPADEPALLGLVEALKQADPSALVTIPVNWVSVGTGPASSLYAKLAPLVDRLNIMTYGMAKEWPGWKTWHSSALDGATLGTPSSVKASVGAYLAAGVPAAKLGVGAGFYGSCWSGGVSAPGQSVGSAKVVANDQAMSFRAIQEGYLKADVRKWDAIASAPFLSFGTPTGPQRCTLVSYEDEASIAAKAAYVKEAGLGGIIVWTLSQGYLPARPAGARHPLLQAASDGLR